MWEPPTVRQTTKLLPLVAQSYRRPDSFSHSHTDKQTPSVKQTTCSKRRQYLYTAACSLAACTPTQALANQRPQLQLRLQLAGTQPSGNGIKMRASSRLASVAAPLSTERHSNNYIARTAAAATAAQPPTERY
jgi:hypothetical protein